jgi:hypothetical protein
MKQTATEWLFEQLWEAPKDKFTWNSILMKAKAMEMEQMEISDREIQQEANERHYGTNFRHVFASGAKWYKKKLNQTYKEDKQLYHPV